MRVSLVVSVAVVALLAVQTCVAIDASPYKFDEDGKIVLDGSLKDLFPAALQLFASHLSRHLQPERFTAEKYPSPMIPWENIMSDFPPEKLTSPLADAATGPYMFMPTLVARLYPNETATWNTSCFSENVGKVAKFDSQGGQFLFQSFNQASAKCTDLYIFATRAGGWFRAFSQAASDSAYTANITVDSWPNTIYTDDIARNGLRIFILPLGVQGTILSAYHTYQLFANVADFQQVNAAWLESVAPDLWGYKKRTAGVVTVPADQVPDGTHLLVSRLDGLESAIQWGVGSWTGHHTIAYRSPSDGQLYVHESTDAPPATSQYWPPPYGIIRTPYEQWIQQAIDADYIVNMMPLSAEYQAKFSTQTAEEWFLGVQGLPYGYHNFLFEWIDEDIQNLPWQPKSFEIFALLFDMMDNHVANGTKICAYSLVLQPFAQRLGQQFDDMNDLYEFYESQGDGDVFEMMAATIDMPEQDDYQYQNNPAWCTNRTSCVGVSRVCDTFVFSIYKAAGVFGDMDIQATEVTPRDAYWMQIYDSNWTKPTQCTDSFQGYCQLMGDFWLELPGANTLPLYSHMNEKCGGLPPSYPRTADC